MRTVGKPKVKEKFFSKEIPEPLMSLSCATSFREKLMNPRFL